MAGWKPLAFRRLRDDGGDLAADGATASAVLGARLPQGLADAVNVTDGAGAKTICRRWRRRHSPITASSRCCNSPCAIEIAWRFRAISSARRPGIHKSSACMRHPKHGDQPETKAVYDIDSRTLMATAHRLREMPSAQGRIIDPKPRLFIGAADSHKIEAGWKPVTLTAKSLAGADFIQTSTVRSRCCAAIWRGFATMAA